MQNDFSELKAEEHDAVKLYILYYEFFFKLQNRLVNLYDNKPDALNLCLTTELRVDQLVI